MVRRSFRFGIWVGLLLGVAFALRKAAERRSDSLRQPADPWTPVPQPAPPVAQPVPDAEPITAPVFVDAPATPELAPHPPAPAVKKAPAKKKAAAAKKRSPAPKPLPAWVEAEDGVCPGSHPIKAKLSSKIFHVPGGLSYPRVRPDRCYTTEEAAAGDGLTKAKR